MGQKNDVLDEDTCLVSVARLRKLCDPFAQPPWEGVAGLTTEGVRQAMQDGFVLAQAYSDPEQIGAPERIAAWTPEEHISRIAYLAHHGWAEPIEVDVGVPDMGCYVDWPVTDGNHRLAAAIVRGDKHILASVSGCEYTMRKLFGRMLPPTSRT